MKKIIISVSAMFMLSSCAELNNVIASLPQDNSGQAQGQTSSTSGGKLSNAEISTGLKEALEQGIINGVDILGKQDGFYKNEMVKILLPEQLQVVDKKLRQFGMGSLADQGLKLLNRAAENAVVKAKPIFMSSIRGLNFSDATSILMGNNNAATEYLKKNTTKELTTAFLPEVKNSLSTVGADKVWGEMISRYNMIPMVEKVNPDLSNYVTDKAIEGLFKQIEVKENQIRTNVSARTTPMLKKVFEKIVK